MSKTKKYTIFKTNNLDFNTVSFSIHIRNQTNKQQIKLLTNGSAENPIKSRQRNIIIYEN